MHTKIPHESIEFASQHEFLDYKDAGVHFIYSFGWETDHGELRPELFTDGAESIANGTSWNTPLLHERVVDRRIVTLQHAGSHMQYVSAYQPTFVTRRRTLELNGEIPVGEIVVLVPLTSSARLDVVRTWSLDANIATLAVRLSWTVRLFDTGMGTFSVQMSIPELRTLPKHERYSAIHWLLHLAPNVDRYPDAHGGGEYPSDDDRAPISDSFLWLPNGLEGSLEPNTILRLYRLANLLRDQAFASVPSSFWSTFDPNDPPRIRAMYEHLAARENLEIMPDQPYTNQQWNEAQAPFVVTSCVLSDASMTELRECVPAARSKEIAAILAKLTLSNARVATDFRFFANDYLRQFMATASKEDRLVNFCLDDRVFFAMSRRGAICLTARPEQGPAGFVIPSFINLCELLRARLHAAVALNWELMQVAREVSALTAPQGGLKREFLRNYARLRQLYVLNVNNPVVHLFDGGSVSEAAAAAEDMLFLRRTWVEVERSFEAVDRLVSTLAAASVR